MLTDLGYPLLVVALLLTLWGMIASALAAARKDQALALSGQRAAIATFVLVTLASLLLIRAFLIHDFSIRYVAEYSNRSLPLFYLLSSLWAGQAGSLLFWVWLMTIYTVIVIWTERRSGDARLLPATLVSMLAITAFFLILATVASNPFERLNYRPADGLGLNPLLRNPEMVIHPPSLYVGFVGFAVPFSFAMAALALGRLDIQWIRKIRRWTLFSWLVLGIGILLGAQWAYVELGWGGYWGWDPVENASLMPWITGTAFLHSVIIQERKGVFKIWNFSLIIITFVLTILGTFITRSGLISSVHAFARTNLGPIFLAFMFIALVIPFGLVFYRYKELRNPPQFRSLFSQEVAILLFNVLFSGLVLMVFWGTLFPSISQGIFGKQLTIQTDWFNRMTRPFGIGLLVLLLFCPTLGWSATSIKALVKRLALPVVVGVLASVVAVALGAKHTLAVVAFALAAGAVTSFLADAVKTASARARATGEPFFSALSNLVSTQRRRYGSYLVHIGVAIMIVGIVGSSTFVKQVTKTVAPGDKLHVGRYELTFRGIQVEKEGDRTSVVARADVTNSGKPIGQMASRKDFYPNYDPVTEVDIRSRLHEDLYFILASFEEDGRATLQVLVNPLTLWIWIGGILLALGSILALLPPRKSKSSA